MPKHLKGKASANSSEKPFEVHRDKTDKTSITDLAKKRLPKPLNDDIDHIEIKERWGLRWTFHTGDKTMLTRGLITKDQLDVRVACQRVRWYKIAAILTGIAGLISVAFKVF